MTTETLCRRTVAVTTEAGLHARPAADFAATASRFAADVRVCKGEHEVDGRSALLLLTLDVRCGDTLTITARGADADEAVETLSRAVGS
jgi:phosphotransferase system HPr (HPr) family protein